MATPRYTEPELWERIRALYQVGGRFSSLVHGKQYLITGLDEARKQYAIRYESGRTKEVSLEKLYALYCELYRIEVLPRAYMRDSANSLRVVGQKTWHAPGATMYAILPVLDQRVQVTVGGDLSVKACRTGQG